MDNASIMRTALEQSAIDCCCSPEDFLCSENSVFESVPSAGVRRYLELPHVLDLVSYGNGIVASCGKELMTPVRELLNGMENPYECFETPEMYILNMLLAKYDAGICFMAEYFLPDVKQVYTQAGECGCELRLLGPEDFADLYTPEWSNALCEKRRELDVLGVGAYSGGKLIGLAACSADCDTMWQIGVDVLPEYRKQGIASTITNRLAREIIRREKVPFYCAAWSNLRSVRNALKSGFRPAWVEVTAKPMAKIQSMLGAK